MGTKKGDIKKETTFHPPPSVTQSKCVCAHRRCRRKTSVLTLTKSCLTAWDETMGATNNGLA